MGLSEGLGNTGNGVGRWTGWNEGCCVGSNMGAGVAKAVSSAPVVLADNTKVAGKILHSQVTAFDV